MIFFEVYLRLQITENGIERERYSGTTIPSSYISTSNSVTLTFQSDSSVTSLGFELNYQSKFSMQNKWVFKTVLPDQNYKIFQDRAKTFPTIDLNKILRISVNINIENERIPLLQFPHQ